MDPIARTLWYIETNHARPIELEEIAQAAGVSRFHLTRAFGQTFGKPVMRYVRGRRLTEAAKLLSNGAPDILSVALEAGYGSHEAFTRAFREEFGVTPDAYRATPNTAHIPTTEAFLVTHEMTIKLAEPRIFDAEPMLFAGIGQRFDYADMGAIPLQWQRFAEHIGHIPGQVRGASYGVCTNSDADGLDYISAVEVKDFGDLPKDYTRLRVPAQRYAIFSHKGHISEIRSVIHAVFGTWIPQSKYEIADAPSLERYGPEFDPPSGTGGYEIWVPIKG